MEFLHWISCLGELWSGGSVCVCVCARARVCLGFAIILCFRKVENFQTSAKWLFCTFTTVICIYVWLRVYKDNFYIAFHFKLCYFDVSFSWVSYWRVLIKWRSEKGQPLNKMDSSLWRLSFLFLMVNYIFLIQWDQF